VNFWRVNLYKTLAFQGWIIRLLRTMWGFVTYRANPGTEIYFLNPSEPSNVAQLALYVFQILIADIVMVSAQLAQARYIHHENL